MTAAHQTPLPLVIRLFGGVEIQADGVPLPKLRSRKAVWLLALLALNPERRVERAWLTQTLWPFPDHATDQAAYNLRRCLTDLRKALGAQAHRIQSPSRTTLCLDLQNARVDSVDFDAAAARADTVSLEIAISLYTGPLLLECTEAWAAVERAKREQQYLRALRVLSAQSVAAGDYEAAIHSLRRAVAVDPLWEPAQRALMETLALSGDTHTALQVYQEFSRRLHQDRNGLPTAETTALYHTLRTELRRLSPSREILPETLPLPSSPPMYRLPIPLTALIGRQEEIQEIETRFRLLRLLTLTGAGGVGKTRLAIQLAEQMASEFRDGVCFVDMAALTDPTQVAQMTAAALEVPEEREQPLTQTLLHFLRSRQLLLILDNCEHLIEACAQLAETLLQGCRFLRILATSRQSLNVGGEGVWRVASLSLPDLQHLPSDTAALTGLLSRYAAIQLFVERASQAEAAFHLTPQNVLAVAQICRQLDGIPLALELAAARVKALPVERIAEWLEDRFRLLTQGPHAALSRQQTLEAAIKWSFDLLSEADRAMLCALSVFAGGWTLEAAEAITKAEGGRSGRSLEKDEGGRMKDELGLIHPLDALTRLVDRSLVLYETEGGQARYRLLETVRQYSRQILMDAATLRKAGERHLDYFLRLAEEAKPHLQGGEQAQWFHRLDREHDNLRAALEWSLTEPACAERSLRLAEALWKFWYRRGYLSLGRRYLAQALEETRTQGSTSTRAEAWIGAGTLASFQGDHEAARKFFEESLAIGAALKDEELQANALHSLGQLKWNRGDHEQARALFTEALALRRRLGHKTQVAVTLNYLGVVSSDAGDQEAARRFLEESLAIGRELEDRSLIANSLHSLAHNAFYQDDYASAREFYSEELKLARGLQNRELTAITLHRLACVEHALEDYPAARRLFEESLVIAEDLAYRDLQSAVLYSLGKTACTQQDFAVARACFEQHLAISEALGDRPGLSYALDAFAALLAAQKQERQAVQLFAAAQSQRETLATHASPINQAEIPRIQAARSALGEEVFAQAWEEGRALTLEQAIFVARQPCGKEK